MSVTMTDDDDLLSMAEVADHCGVDYETVRKWVKAGVLPYVEIGPTCIKRVRRRDAARMIKQGGGGPPGPLRTNTSTPRK